VNNQLEGNVEPGAARLSETKRRLLQKCLKAQPGKGTVETALISQRPSGEPVPLSFAQQQVWLHEEMAGETPIYNETITVYREGPCDIDVLEQCLLEIIRRHEIWRTTFDTLDREVVQIVHPAPQQFHLPVIDLRKLPEAERETEANRLATTDAGRPFDLKAGPLLRALLVRIDDDQHRLHMVLHQIICDAVTLYSAFLPELATLYEAFSAGRPSPLPEPRIQYADFAYWQQKRFRQGIWSDHMAYWRKQLAGELPLLPWPNDHARPPIETHRGAIQRFSLPASLIHPLRSLSQRQGVSLYMTLLAGFFALLHRYTGQEEIILGGVTAGRKLTELESVPGYFANPLPLRVNLSANPTFRELQSRVRAVVLDALAHEDVPFVHIKESQHRSDPGRNPLFQIIFSQQPKLPKVAPGWDLATTEVSNGASKLDLLIVIDDRGDEVFGPITYNPDLFDASTITRMVGHWQTLLTGVCADAGQRIADLPILTEVERRQILVDWNDTQVDYPQNVCLAQLIEAQVQRTPEGTAVVYEQDRLSYRELNARANQLAHYLRKLGVGPDVLVGVCMERSFEMITGLLGTLKAGGAYLPLDPDYPKDRLCMILEDSRVAVLLTQQSLLNRLPPSAAPVICLDAGWEEIARNTESNPVSVVGPQNLAYALYTSGSTGKPKGVLNVHRGIVNRLLWMQAAYQLTPADRVLQKTPYSFDVSVWEFFWPLMAGACLVIAKPGGHKDADYLVDLIQREKITTVHFVPSMLGAFLEVDGVETCISLKRVICSGEALPFELHRRFFTRLSAELHNLYGPTEAAVDVTSWRCRAECEEPLVPIGRPIANVQIYILDRNLEPVPVGVQGELHIGGVALARGYLNSPELTAQKFIRDPFSSEPGARLYKTGDLARYRPDGNIEFLGRVDDLVKIRGFRIELGEIEAVLHECPAVRDARVIVREEPGGDRRLVAYIVPMRETASAPKDILGYLKDKLPNYMIPTLVMLDKLPLTPNGKFDRRALPPSEPPETEEVFERPRDPVEQLLAGIWTEVLGVEQISVYDNFFDLGGHSLMAMHVVARLRDQLGLRVRPNELAFQTLGQFAASCKERLLSR
jgi:amino acid adenylation domain-containing protein